MSSLEIQPGGDGRYQLRGELTFATVTAAWQAGQTLFAGARAVALDLGGVARVDSAGLALLVEWIRQGRAEGWSLALENVPPQLLAIARVSGLVGLLGLAA